ncbi:hypothetical protein D3C78_798200 [compost metagenome]
MAWVDIQVIARARLQQTLNPFAELAFVLRHVAGINTQEWLLTIEGAFQLDTSGLGTGHSHAGQATLILGNAAVDIRRLDCPEHSERTAKRISFLRGNSRRRDPAARGNRGSQQKIGKLTHFSLQTHTGVCRAILTSSQLPKTTDHYTRHDGDPRITFTDVPVILLPFLAGYA